MFANFFALYYMECVSSLKFLEGRVYIQTGKVLKPAHVVYSKEPPQPVKASNDDSKAPAKNKQSNCSSTVVLEPSTKPEVIFFFFFYPF